MSKPTKNIKAGLWPQKANGAQRPQSSGLLYQIWIGLEITTAMGFLGWMFIF
jgi:hypothetical protein